MFERRFGIRAYDYWWGYPAVLIDLMAIDQPIVVYYNTEKKHTKDEMDKVAERWAEKHKKMAGEKINLSDWFKQ